MFHPPGHCSGAVCFTFVLFNPFPLKLSVIDLFECSEQWPQLALKKIDCLTSSLAESKMLSCDYFLAVLNLFPFQTPQIYGVNSAISEVMRSSLKIIRVFWWQRFSTSFTCRIFVSNQALWKQAASQTCGGAQQGEIKRGKIFPMSCCCWWLRYARVICRFFGSEGYFLA